MAAVRILLVLLSLWRASALPGNSNNGFEMSIASAPFLYQESYTVDLSEDDADEEPQMDVSSALLYDQGCLVSSQAVMYQGGDFEQDISNHHLFESLLEESDDEEDDDEDDDGHSSMLSNASLKRTRTPVGAIGSNRSPLSHHKSSSMPFSSLTSNAHGGLNSVMALRGGAAVGATPGTEVLQKLFVTALVTLIFEAMIGHVLEFLKIVMQTSPDGTTYTHVVSDITKSKGVFGLWDGFCPWGIVQSVFKGAVFGVAHSMAVRLLVPLADEGYLPMALALTLAGGIGGGFQGYVLSPTMLLKTRVMTNPVFREKMSLLRSSWLSFRIGFEVVRQEGFLTLMKGSNVLATKRVFDWASRFFFADLFESLFVTLKGGVALTFAEKCAASLCGGVASTFVTLPLDVLVSKTQDAKKAGVKVSAWKLFTDELNEKGVSGLRDAYLRGFEARLAHVCLTTLVMKTLTPVVYEAMFGDANKSS